MDFFLKTQTVLHINVDLRKAELETWMEMVEGRVQCRAVLLAILNFTFRCQRISSVTSWRVLSDACLKHTLLPCMEQSPLGDYRCSSS